MSDNGQISRVAQEHISEEEESELCIEGRKGPSHAKVDGGKETAGERSAAAQSWKLAGLSMDCLELVR